MSCCPSVSALPALLTAFQPFPCFSRKCTLREYTGSLVVGSVNVFRCVIVAVSGVQLMTYRSGVTVGAGLALLAWAARSAFAIVVCLSIMPATFTVMKSSAMKVPMRARSPLTVASPHDLSNASSAALSACEHSASRGEAAKGEISTATAAIRKAGCNLAVDISTPASEKQQGCVWSLCSWETPVGKVNRHLFVIRARLAGSVRSPPGCARARAAGIAYRVGTPCPRDHD